MKNLKKVLALVTVVAVLLTCVPAFAVSYSDVPATASYAEAVEMTSALGIFTGYPDGTFKPDDTITRAEAAAVITRFLGKEAVATAMAGTTVFTDMADAAWATGYVNYGVQQKYINGMGDGTYAPADAVTYEQMVKLIVAALGYTIKAENNGGYPSGYLAVASQLGITKGTSGSTGAASRGTVARLIYNALTVDTMYISKYNSDGTLEYAENGTPVLYGELKVTEYVGVVTDTYMIGLTDIEADKTVSIRYEEVNGEDEVGTETLMVGATDAADYLGYKVTAYVAENEETGEDEIIAISAKGNQNDVVTVKADDLTETGEINSTSKVYYWKNKDADKKPAYVDLAAGVKVYTNYATDDIEGLDLTGLAGGVVTFISNDGDNDAYEYIIVTTYDVEFVVDDIDAENYIIEGKSTGYLDMNPEDETTLYYIVKDGVAASFEDIAVGDTISQVGTSGIVVLNVSSASVSGTVTRVAGDKYTIDGTQYEKTADCASITNGSKGIFYLNVDGLIVDYEAEADATGFYGYFIASDYKTSFGKNTWSIQYVDENGTDVTSTLASKVKFGTGNVTGASIKSEDIASDATGAALEVYNFLNGAPTVFKYDTNAEGEITKIILAGAPDAGEIGTFTMDVAYAEDKVRYNAEDNTAGNVAFADETIVFSVADVVEDADDVTVTTVSAIFEDDVYTCAFKAYDLDKNDVAAAIVATGATAAIDEASNVIVVTEVGTAKFDDESGYYVKGIQAGEEVELLICDEIEEYNGVDVMTLTKGDVIMVATGIEYVTDLAVKVDAETIAADQIFSDYKGEEDAVEELIRQVAKKDGNKLTFTEEFDSEYGVDGKATTLSLGNKSAEYTLVSKVNRTTVKASAYSAINPVRYDYVLYIRTVDGKVIDVVIYEYAKGESPLVEAPATEAPTEEVTEVPTEEATEVPTEEATEVPTEEATEVPTEEATEVPTEEATEVPTEEATEVPTEEATEVPTEEATEVPTEDATEVPTEEAEVVLEANFASPYLNGSNGSIVASDATSITMLKDAAGSNFNIIIWTDAIDADTTDTDYTLTFNATVSGGYGHSWDGYAVALRTTSGGDVELIRLVPTAQGVDIAKGAGSATLASVTGTGEHSYKVVFNKVSDTIEISVDGEVVVAETTLGWSGATQHGIYVKSGHNEATNCQLVLSDFVITK